MKIFSEDETMVSTSVGSELSLPRSPLEEIPRQGPRTSSPVKSRGREERGSEGREVEFVRGTKQQELESPTKARRMSFKVR